MMSGDVRKYDLQGAFGACPIPTLIVEGAWDLTWNTDKPEKLHNMLPRAKLAVIDRAGHSPFADQPEQFALLLRDFLQKSPRASDADVSLWKSQLLTWKVEKEKSPAFILRTSGSGRKSNQRIAEHYRPEWLDQIKEPFSLLQLGMALYDVKRYPDALAAFERMGQTAADNKLASAISGIWQAQMLDLMGKREQAVSPI